MGIFKFFLKSFGVSVRLRNIVSQDAPFKYIIQNHLLHQPEQYLHILGE